MRVPVVKVGDVAEQIRGVSYSKDDASAVQRPGYLPVLRAGNISDEGLRFDDLVFVPESRVSLKQRVRKDDVLIAASSGSLDVVGKAARVLADYEGGFGAFCKVLRPNAAVDGGYFAHYFRTPGYRRRVSALAAGININNLRNEDLDEMLIPAPPIREQRRIAAILDRADALRVQRRAAVEHVKALETSVFVSMFGDPSSNPKNLPTVTLDELFVINRGGSPRPIDDFITEAEDGINWILIGDASEGGKYIRRTRKRVTVEGAKRSRAVRPGDFLLTNSMSFGRPYIVQTSGCVHDGWLVLSPRTDQFVADYFYTLLGSGAMFAEFVRRAPGATVKNLNIDLVRSVRVPVGSLLFQRDFARAVRSIENVISVQLRVAQQLDALFASLQHRAFRGEL